MSSRRVVITGLGAITPLGLSVAESWQGILAGKSGVAVIDEFDTQGYSTTICGTVKKFDIGLYLSAKEARKVDLFIQYAIAAAAEAVVDAGLDFAREDVSRIGVAVGSGIGGLSTIENNHTVLVAQGSRKVSPFFIPASIINMASGHISILHGLQGPNISVVTACTTGTHNIGYAARTIAYGDADVMLAGGAEKGSSPLGMAGFSALRALSKRNDDPQRASRPWDKDRDGFVLGDGAGVLVLEEYEHAKKRGATIYAELAGFGLSADAFHMTLPDQEGRGAQQAMRAALRDARQDVSEVQYINAHATSTPAGDELEAFAIKKVFANQQKQLAVSSTKSMIGHLLGAAGAVEAIFTVLAIRDQVAPPTINLDQPSESCDLDFVPHTARPMRITAAMSNSFGFGGTNGALLFRQL